MEWGGWGCLEIGCSGCCPDLDVQSLIAPSWSLCSHLLTIFFFPSKCSNQFHLLENREPKYELAWPFNKNHILFHDRRCFNARLVDLVCCESLFPSLPSSCTEMEAYGGAEAPAVCSCGLAWFPAHSSSEGFDWVPQVVNCLEN